MMVRGEGPLNIGFVPRRMPTRRAEFLSIACASCGVGNVRIGEFRLEWRSLKTITDRVLPLAGAYVGDTEHMNTARSARGGCRFTA